MSGRYLDDEDIAAQDEAEHADRASTDAYEAERDDQAAAEDGLL